MFLIFLFWHLSKFLSLFGYLVTYLKLCKLLWHVQVSRFCESLMWISCTHSGDYFKWFSPDLGSDFEQTWDNWLVSSDIFINRFEWVWLVLGAKFGDNPLCFLIPFIVFYILLNWSSCCLKHTYSTHHAIGQ